MTPVFRGYPARRPAYAASDIQHQVAGFRLKQRDKLPGREHAAAVEMVDRRQRLRSYWCVGAVGVAQRGEDAVGDAASSVTTTAVVTRDRVWVWACHLLFL